VLANDGQAARRERRIMGLGWAWFHNGYRNTDSRGLASSRSLDSPLLLVQRVRAVTEQKTDIRVILNPAQPG
jgi:hypothetical protein